MLSQTVEYALRAIVYLAAQPDAARTTDQIAEVTHVPRAYLSKVMQSLSREGLVRSQRGLHGGFTLSRVPEELTVIEVVNAVEPLRRIRECPLGLRSHGANMCPMHRRLDEAIAMVEKAFSETTIAAILAEPTEFPPLCEFPRGRTQQIIETIG